MSMNITPVDSLNNLFLVEDFYPQEIIEQINQTNFFEYKYEPIMVQGVYTRRNIKADKLLRRLESISHKSMSKLSKQIGVDVSLDNCGFWLDTAGYYMDKHIDGINHVIAGMQIYITEGDKSLGTCFYNTDGSIRYQFPYKVNSGYLMINNIDQVHAMPNKLPDDSHRFSVYHWIKLK